MSQPVGSKLLTAAVVLSTVDYGEADRVVTLFTRDLGKVAAIARGVRKGQRRFGAGVSAFGVGEATLRERPAAELMILDGFEAGPGWPGLLEDMAKMAHAGYACELVRELSPMRQPDQRIFTLLVEMLDLLDGAPARTSLLRSFELHLLDAVGLQPTLDRCVRCASDEAALLDEDGQRFDWRLGGVVCAHCQSQGRGAGQGRTLDGPTRRALLEAQQRQLRDTTEWDLPEQGACREVLTGFLRHHLPRPLKSMEFIAKLNHARVQSR